MTTTDQQPDAGTLNPTGGGVATINPFFNYLRDYRMHTQLRRSAMISQAAAGVWYTLTYAEKMPYVLQAKRVQRRRRQLRKSPELPVGGQRRRRRRRRRADGLIRWPSVAYIN